jgi:hypothetical protein
MVLWFRPQVFEDALLKEPFHKVPILDQAVTYWVLKQNTYYPVSTKLFNSFETVNKKLINLNLNLHKRRVKKLCSLIASIGPKNAHKILD